MRKQELRTAKDILTMIDTARAEMQRLELDEVNRGRCEKGVWVLPQRQAELTNLINNILQPELEQLLRTVLRNPEHKAA